MSEETSRGRARGFWVGPAGQRRFLSADSVLVAFEEGLLDASTLLHITEDAPGRPLSRYVRELVMTAASDFDGAVTSEVGLFEAAFARAPIGMVYSDLGGAILHCNEIFAKTLGYSPDELVGKRVGELSEEAGREREIELGNRLLSGAIPSFEVDKVFIDRNGGRVLTKTAIALIRDGSGIPTAAVAHILDVRGTLDLEERLEQQRIARESSEKRFERMFRFAPQAMLLVTRDGLVQHANRRAETFFGRPESELVTRSLAEIGDESGTVTRHVSSLDLDDQVVDSMVSTFVLSVGGERRLSFGFASLSFDEQEQILVGFTDVSAEYAATAALEASLAEKEMLLREIHHRVKNNLAMVQSLLQLQASRLDSPEARSALDESARRIATMATVHERLYGMGSLSSVDLAQYTVSLVKAVQDAYAPDANVVVEASKSDIPMKLAVPIGLMLNELVTNAFKYGLISQHDNGRPDVYVGLCVEDRHLHVVVADRGTKCSPDVLTTSRNSFGMRLVSALVRQLRGSITVDLEHGTKFSIQCEVI